MRLKSHLLAGALLALGGFALAPGEAKAYTGYCQSMPVTWAAYADQPAGGVSSTGTGDRTIGDSFLISNAMDLYPTIRTQCSDTVYLNNPSYQCTMWNTLAQHAMTAGTRSDLRNGQPTVIPVYAATAFAQPGGWGTPITGIRWSKMGEITCLYTGSGGTTIIQPPPLVFNPSNGALTARGAGNLAGSDTTNYGAFGQGLRGGAGAGQGHSLDASAMGGLLQ